MSETIFRYSNNTHLKKLPCRLVKRHYKKDSRFVLDLYTLTYDSHESLDSLGDLSERRFDNTADIQNITDDNKTVSKSVNNARNGNAKNNFVHRYRRPSLQSRLQDGKNLQLCFLNQQSSEVDDHQLEDGALSLPILQSKYLLNDRSTEFQEEPENVYMSSEFNLRREKHDTNNNTKINLHDLQNEVCTSLKKIYVDTNRRVELNHRRRSDSPITCTIKTSLKKVGIISGENTHGRRRMSRQMLTKMNPDQLQTIIDDLHAHVEFLNEQLMKMLMERDELHMSRDSLLVDIDDITAYLNAKDGYQKSSFTKLASDANHSNNYIISDPAISSICTKKVILPGLRFKRLTSHT